MQKTKFLGWYDVEVNAIDLCGKASFKSFCFMEFGN